MASYEFTGAMTLKRMILGRTTLIFFFTNEQREKQRGLTKQDGTGEGRKCHKSIFDQLLPKK
jgi:hypothetical protein